MLNHEFMRSAFIVSALISVLCPCIGVFLVMRRFSMIGDTLSHASLAGVTIGLVLKTNPVAGAFIFTSLCGALIELLRGLFKKNTDLILSIVLAACVGTAITIMSTGALRTSAENFMFGSILTVTRLDMLTVLVLSIISVLTLILLYHELIYTSCDEDAAKIAGVRVRLINYVFLVLVSCAISVSIRIVGVLVLSSMLTLPVASAIQLGKGFKLTLIFSVIFSVIDIMAGLYFSYYLGVAPGGLTALISVAVFAVAAVTIKVRQSVGGGKADR